jgi:hypothetical protein
MHTVVFEGATPLKYNRVIALIHVTPEIPYQFIVFCALCSRFLVCVVYRTSVIPFLFSSGRNSIVVLLLLLTLKLCVNQNYMHYFDFISTTV